MKSRLETLGRQLAESRDGRKGPAVRYPRALRDAAARQAAEGLEAGQSFSAIARCLGVAPGTLERWGASAPEQRFRPIEVEEGTSTASSTITLVTPSGFRFEGLDPAQAADLLARLDARQ